MNGDLHKELGEKREETNFPILDGITDTRRKDAPSLASTEDGSQYIGIYIDEEYELSDEEVDHEKWSRKIDRRKGSIQRLLSKIEKMGDLIDGSIEPEIYYEDQRCVIKIDCEVEICVNNPKQKDRLKELLKRIQNDLEGAGVPQEMIDNCKMGAIWKGSLYIMFCAPTINILQQLHQYYMNSKASTDAIQITMIPLFLAKVDKKITNLVRTERNNSLKKQKPDDLCDLLISQANNGGVHLIIPTSVADPNIMLNDGMNIGNFVSNDVGDNVSVANCGVLYGEFTPTTALQKLIADAVADTQSASKNQTSKARVANIFHKEPQKVIEIEKTAKAQVVALKESTVSKNVKM